MTRIFSIIVSSIILTLAMPFLLLISLIIYLSERKDIFYKPYRIGKNGKKFRMYKFRSMIVNADNSQIDSTKDNDERITRFGKFIRKYKFDELPQFYNVLKGDMNIIGPRPNIEREVNIYTVQERSILNVKPGITDLSSIVFSDLGQILNHSDDPNIAYNQLVRPWKSRLCLFYVENRSFMLDILIFILTILSMIYRKLSLHFICQLLKYYDQDADLIRICSRKDQLVPSITIGAKEIIYERNN